MTKYGKPRLPPETKCPQRFLEELGAHLQPKCTARGEQIVPEGNYGSDFVVLLSGKLPTAHLLPPPPPPPQQLEVLAELSRLRDDVQGLGKLVQASRHEATEGDNTLHQRISASETRQAALSA